MCIDTKVNKSREVVYKVKECAPQFPGGCLKIADHVDPPIHNELKWNIYSEKDDNFLDLILNHVSVGRSFTCLGPPGVGQTYVLSQVYDSLTEAGERVICLGPTHCSAQLLPDGHTAHYFLCRFGMKEQFKGWILLDEISMLPLPLLAAFDQLRMNGTKICIFGDWHQLAPHPDSNSWRGTSISANAFQKSRIYKLWSDSTLFELTKCRRSDETHFNFYTFAKRRT